MRADSSAQPASERVRVRRRAERARYDLDLVHEVLDGALLCRIAFVHDGQPFIQPTLVVRQDDQLFFHGSHTNRMFAMLCAGDPLCVEATIVDGLVLGRSVYQHSMNFRSVVVLGRGVEIVDREAKLEAMLLLMERVVPGRHSQLRPLSNVELAGTRVISMKLSECSAKVRVGPPNDTEDDLMLPSWAGELPLRLVPGTPVPDPRLAPGTPVPDHVLEWGRSRAAFGV